MLLRNNNSRFAQNPTLEKQRSSFYREHGHKTTFNSGDLIPIYWDEILPGDTVNMDMSSVVRMTTPIHPTMDNANFEYMWFFVPNRLIYDDWEHFITGGLDAGAWDTPNVYAPPMVRPRWSSYAGGTDYLGYAHKSLADYMGVPVGFELTEDGSDLVRSTDIADGVSALPFRAYAKIWNDWFRSSSIQQEALIPTTGGLVDNQAIFARSTDDTMEGYTKVYNDGTRNYFIKNNSSVYGGSLLKACKYHDFFTSCLLEPQRGEPVAIPVESGVSATIPVYAQEQNNVTQAQYNELRLAPVDGLAPTVALNFNGSNYNIAGTTPNNTNGLVPMNLAADISLNGNPLSISINDLRHAIAIQHILEIDARSGSGRYIDLLLGHFGVSSPDARLQRAEYLGGDSIPINIDQVLQTSATNDVSPQGNTAAYSLTASSGNVFTKSFTEHGILMCLAVVRHVHTYQQGIDRKWTRHDRYDYFWPSLANISEQAVLNRQIFVSGDPEVDNEVFGYNEAWAEYRYSPSIVTGAMRSSYPQSLDVWHFADDYETTPALSPDWLLEGSSEIDRTLAVSSAVEDQFIMDCFFKPQYYRVMPVYSVPGLERL